jgi:hypothetical protein
MKKKLNVALIVIVAALWGTVGYKFISNYVNKNEIQPNRASVINIKKLATARDTFQLAPIPRDPFLNSFTNKPANNSVAALGKNNIARISSKPVNTVKKAAVASIVEWPDIQYFGYIKSSKTNETVLLKINSQMMRIHKGQTQNGITLLNISKDSIAISFNKEKRHFRRT